MISRAAVVLCLLIIYVAVNFLYFYAIYISILTLPLFLLYSILFSEFGIFTKHIFSIFASCDFNLHSEHNEQSETNPLNLLE